MNRGEPMKVERCATVTCCRANKDSSAVVKMIATVRAESDEEATMVQWDDGTFTFAWGEFLSPAGVGNCHVTFGNIQELAKRMQKTADERQDNFRDRQAK